jgi:hypothetical protein
MPNPIVVPDPPKPIKEITVSKDTLQALLSASRAVYAQMEVLEDPSMEVASCMAILNTAIDDAHTALDTNRGFADEYVRLFGGVTRQQMTNIKKLLGQEGFPVT